MLILHHLFHLTCYDLRNEVRYNRGTFKALEFPSIPPICKGGGRRNPQLYKKYIFIVGRRYLKIKEKTKSILDYLNNMCQGMFTNF